MRNGTANWQPIFKHVWSQLTCPLPKGKQAVSLKPPKPTSCGSRPLRAPYPHPQDNAAAPLLRPGAAQPQWLCCWSWKRKRIPWEGLRACLCQVLLPSPKRWQLPTRQNNSLKSKHGAWGGDHSRVMKTLGQLIFNSSNMSTQCQGGSSCISPPRLFFSRKTRCKIIHVDKTPYLQSSGIFCGTACTQCPRLTRHRALPRCLRVTTIACDVDTDISTPLAPLGRQHLCAHSLLPRISCRTGNTSQEGFKTCW